MGVIISNIIRFLAIIIFQVAVLNNIQFNGYINPYVYILFIMMLPVDIPKVLSLILSFVLGISVDIFCNTPGIHASACVFLAFVRPNILSLMAQRDGYENNSSPSMKDFGFSWFFKYTILTTIIHHSFLFLVEVFSLSNFADTLLRILLSSFFTILILIIIHIASLNKTTN
ncbi:MAG: rod shape-determining protein MreD [Marinifilaceae bacterium]|jgi:rod shape-determining protein MreD|nr:rod shape-determining protein MreD [Marinifilaceae bacterium]